MPQLPLAAQPRRRFLEYWHCLYQYCYGGISRDSSIPNSLYNAMRKKCYRTCLKRIEQHPHDIFAMNCAASIGGRVYLNRFGEYLFGNEAVVEKHTMLSGRDEQAAADGEEGDGEERDGEE